MRRLALVAALALPLQAQCVMCYRTSHAQNAARSHVLNAGILVLGAPPFLILTGFCVFLRRKNSQTND
jgi:hypothetical protein